MDRKEVIMEKASEFKKDKTESFVGFVIEKLKVDTGFGAALRRADNPATEYQSWEHLASWCELDKPWVRLPFATIAAALARAKPQKDGYMGIGQALAACYGKNTDPAKARLRRLLACRSTEEACRIMRPILSLIASKGQGSALDYSSLLRDLLYFGEKQRLKWAEDFYGRRRNDSDDAQS